jgi:hypothetical protein
MMKKWWRIPKKSQRRAFTRAPLASASNSCRSWIWTWGTRQILDSGFFGIVYPLVN